MQKPSPVIGCVRKQLSAPDANEQIEIFTLEPFAVGAGRGFCECGVSNTEGARITAQSRQTVEQRGVGTARQKRCQQRVLTRPRLVDFITHRTNFGKALP